MGNKGTRVQKVRIEVHRYGSGTKVRIEKKYKGMDEVQRYKGTQVWMSYKGTNEVEMWRVRDRLKVGGNRLRGNG